MKCRTQVIFKTAATVQPFALTSDTQCTVFQGHILLGLYTVFFCQGHVLLGLYTVFSFLSGSQFSRTVHSFFCQGHVLQGLFTVFFLSGTQFTGTFDSFFLSGTRFTGTVHSVFFSVRVTI